MKANTLEDIKKLINNINNINNYDDFNATWLAKKYNCKINDIKIKETTQGITVYLLNDKIIYIE